MELVDPVLGIDCQAPLRTADYTKGTAVRPVQEQDVPIARPHGCVVLELHNARACWTAREDWHSDGPARLDQSDTGARRSTDAARQSFDVEGVLRGRQATLLRPR